jgi:hypothetical protein
VDGWRIAVETLSKPYTLALCIRSTLCAVGLLVASAFTVSGCVTYEAAKPEWVELEIIVPGQPTRRYVKTYHYPDREAEEDSDAEFLEDEDE